MPRAKDQLSDVMRVSGRPLLGPLVRDAYRWYQDAVVAHLTARGEPPLTLAQFELLARIDRDGTTISELARRMRITRQSAGQAVGELVSAGFVTVEPHPGSARSKLVVPTRLGDERLALVQSCLVDIEHRVAERLGQDKVEVLRELLAADWGDPAVK